MDALLGREVESWCERRTAAPHSSVAWAAAAPGAAAAQVLVEAPRVARAAGGCLQLSRRQSHSPRRQIQRARKGRPCPCCRSAAAERREERTPQKRWHCQAQCPELTLQLVVWDLRVRQPSIVRLCPAWSLHSQSSRAMEQGMGHGHSEQLLEPLQAPFQPAPAPAQPSGAGWLAQRSDD